MSVPGTGDNPLKVAIVGAGPSGFYAAEALLKSDRQVRIDMIERLPAPYGLVRHGVAPDHPKLKEAIASHDRIARSPNSVLPQRHRGPRRVRGGGAPPTVVIRLGRRKRPPSGEPGEDRPAATRRPNSWAGITATRLP
jgi:hypothetical protein